MKSRRREDKRGEGGGRERKPNFGRFCCSEPFVCQVWLSSEYLIFSYCAWVWNWLIWSFSIHSKSPWQQIAKHRHCSDYLQQYLAENWVIPLHDKRENHGRFVMFGIFVYYYYYYYYYLRVCWFSTQISKSVALQNYRSFSHLKTLSKKKLFHIVSNFCCCLCSFCFVVFEHSKTLNIVSIVILWQITKYLYRFLWELQNKTR